MKVVVQITESIKVRIAPQPKKKKTEKTTYDLHLRFTVSQYGITQKIVDISTGIPVISEDWTSSGLKGRSEKAKFINSQLQDYVATAKHHLEQLKVRPNVVGMDVANEIHSVIKPAITGKAPRGKKSDLAKQVRHWTVNAVLEDLIIVKKPSSERRRIYKHAFSILHQFYGGNTH